MLVVDAHAHIGFSHPYAPLRVRTTEGIVKLMDRFGIDKACVSSLLGIYYNFVEGNAELKREVEKFPDRFIPFCVVQPRYGEEALLELRKCVKEWGWKGLKLHPSAGGYPADCLSAQRVVEEAVRLRIPVAIHTWIDDLSRPWRVGNLAEMFPDATLIMYHMGWFQWQEALEQAKKYDNIILDTTQSMYIRLVEPVVKAIGAERVVWGTNLPISYPGPNLVRVKTARITEEERRLILGENMLRILKLKT